MSLTLTITDAGRQALINESNTGTLPLTISHIAVGNGQYEPSADQTALVSEVKQLVTFGGAVVAGDVIHLTIRDESTDTYALGEFGLMTDGGVLFAVYSQVGEFILEKNASGVLLLTVDATITTIDVQQLEFGGTGFLLPPGTETVSGVLQLADNATALAGTDHTKAMTPKTAKAVMNQHKVENLAHDWNSIGGKPSSFPPSAHGHLLEDIEGAGTAAGKNVGTETGNVPVYTTDPNGRGGLSGWGYGGLATVIPNDALPRATGFYAYSGSDSPFGIGAGGNGFRVGATAGRLAEFMVSVDTVDTYPHVYARGQREVDVWSDPVEMWHNGNFDPTTKLDKTGGTIAVDGFVDFGPNSTWGSILRVGGNGRTIADSSLKASIAVTSGNLHIDSGTTMATYLNYYAGTGGIKFGSGAETIVAVMGPDGDLWKGSADNAGSKYWHAGNLTPPSTSIGGVGTTALMFNTLAAGFNPGETTAGSNLRYTVADGVNTAPDAISGTWRCMGWCFGSDLTAVAAKKTTTWLRIS
jgi:hypothetical protein